MFMKKQFSSLFTLFATIAPAFAQFPTGADALGQTAWYFDNNGTGPSIAGADANLRDAYETEPRQISPDGSMLEFDGGTYSGNDIVIAIISDGIAPHPEFFVPGGAIGADWPNLAGQEGNATVLMALGLSPNPGLTPGNVFALPTSGSDLTGTAMAGLVRASNDGAGISGIAYNSSLLPIRLTGSTSRNAADDATALLHRLGSLGNFDPTLDASIYNASFGAATSNNLNVRNLRLIPLSDTVEEAFRTGTLQGRGGSGAIYVFPAGDLAAIGANSNYDGYANSPYTIAVGAFTDTGVRAEYSEPGANLIVSAPSGGGSRDLMVPSFTLGAIPQPFGPIPPNLVYSPPTPPASQLAINFSGGSGFRTDEGGTNAAASIASSVIALMLEARSEVMRADPGVAALGWRDVQDILIRSARQIDPNDTDWIFNGAGIRFNHNYGAGAIDASAAVRMAEEAVILPAREQIEQGQVFGQLVPDNTGTPFIASFDFSDEENLRIEHVVVNVTALGGRRSDLDINLVSPSGTISRLAESSAGGAETNISRYPFMTARNWGETSRGVWTVTITDRVSGEQMEVDNIGITVFGTATEDTPANTAPVLLSDFVIEGVQGQPLNTEIVVVGLSPDGLSFSDLPEGLTLEVREESGQQRFFVVGAPVNAGAQRATLNLQGPGGSGTQNIIFSIEPVSNTFGDAIGINGLDGRSGGDLPWEIVTDTNGETNVFDGTEAIASSGNLSDNQQSIFTFDNVPGEIATFYWRVNSETSSDRLYVSNGGPAPQNWLAFIDGDVDYDIVGVQLGGSRGDTIQWTFAKDAFDNVNIPTDRGFVDQLELFESAELFLDDPNPASSPGGVVQQAGMNFVPLFDSRTIWVPVDDPIRAGNRVLKASKIGGGQQVSLSYWAPATSTASILTFDYLVSSEVGNDVLEVLVNGVPAAGMIDGIDFPAIEISGEVAAWGTISVPLTANQRNFVQIIYRKNSTVSSGSDTAWIDDITISQSRPAPLNTEIDTDGDGFTDFQELAFGGDKDVKDNTLKNIPVLVHDGGNFMTLEVPFDPTVSGVDYQLQQSIDLDNWVDIDVPVAISEIRNGVNIHEIPVFVGPDMPMTFYRLQARPRTN